MKKDLNLTVQNVSKIEGHASVGVKVKKGKVEEVHIMFTENKRFFTEAMRGQNYRSLPQSTARICGTCSLAHTIGAIKALENALGLKPSKQTTALKHLTMNGLMIRDHALHLYLFGMPDIFNKDSVMDFTGVEREYLKDAFAIKRAGNNLSTIIAGAAVHAPFPHVGYFSQVPKKKDIAALKKELKAVRKKVFPMLDLYVKYERDYTRNTQFTALCGVKPFNFLEGNIRSSNGKEIMQDNYLEHLEKVVLPYSQAIGYAYDGETYMVGALARLNLNKEALLPETKKDCKKYLKVFPSNNIFHNNLAQGIEIIHCIDHSLKLLTMPFKKEEEPKIKEMKKVGVGVIEAPRGLLYYKTELNEEGEIVRGNIITPSQQNQVNMEKDIKQLVQKLIDKGEKDEEVIRVEIEKLIRAYDPCISCATHFLKLKIEEVE